MTLVRIDQSEWNVRAILTSSDAANGCQAAAEQIADRARSRGIMVEGEPGDVPLPVTVVKGGSAYRARSFVVIDHPSGLAVEAKHRLLGGSV